MLYYVNIILCLYGITFDMQSALVVSVVKVIFIVIFQMRYNLLTKILINNNTQSF